MRRALGILIVLALAPATAQASPAQESTFQDDNLLLYGSDETVDGTMAELAALGVDRVRISVVWRDPRLEAVDRAVEAARAHGVGVLLNVRGDAPDSAEGAKRPASLGSRHAFKPSARKFGAFVREVGARYPTVDAWSIWNEPNWHALLQPQSVKGRPRSPGIYRGLFRAAQAALAATGHGGDAILLGETAPVGSDRVGPGSPIDPARFYRWLFCLDARLKPVRKCGDYKRRGPLPATGVAHHPYSVKDAPEQRSRRPDEIRLADGRRLERILDAAARYHRLPGRLPVYYTEFGYQTKPDPIRGIPLKRQAAWLVRAEYLAYRDRRVLAFNQFLLRDAPPLREFEATDRRYWFTYQTGLRYEDGRPKPALDAYRLPLLRLNDHRLWGMVRPGGNGALQTIRIERRVGRRWKATATKTVRDPRGYFTTQVRRGRYRFVWLGPGGEVASRSAVSR